MGGRVYSDEMLMAYADGELTPDLDAEIESDRAADPVLAQRIEVFRETRSLARRAFEQRPAMPANHDLTARIEAMVAKSAAAQPRVERMIPAAANSNAPQRLRLLAAASVAAALAMAAGGYTLGLSQTGQTALAAIGSPIEGEVSAHLSSAPAGERQILAGGHGEIEVVGTFLIGATTCREFEIAQPDSLSSISVACFSDGSWKTSFAMLVASRTDAFVPASSAEPIDAYLEALSAGSPLSPDAEAAALQALK